MIATTLSLVRTAKRRHVILMLGAVFVLTLSTLATVGLTQSSRTITTVAGTGVCGFSGDGGSATSAQLNSPAGLATDLAGNLYIADFGNNVVRKVTPFGTVTTVAGTGASGFNGDNRLATNAQLAAPVGVAVDAGGRNLYIADNGNHAIRRVDLQTLTISTVAGMPTQSGFSGDGGLATQARLNSPSAIAVDNLNNLYIADNRNFRVRRVDTNGVITTVAGIGERGFSGDNGPATQARLKGVVALALRSMGDLFIADNEDHRVRRVSSSGIITTFAGNGSFVPPTPGPATESSVRWPQGLATDANGSLYIADNASHMVLRVGQDGILSIVAGVGFGGFGGDNGPATQAFLNGPSGLVVDRFNNLFISDTLNCRVRRVSAP